MLIKNVGFLKKKPKELSFDMLTWKTLTTLLEQKRSFAESLSLIKTKKNQHVIDFFISKLEQGESVESILLYMKKDAIAKQLGFYLSFIPLTNALHTAIDMVTFEKETKKQLQQSLLYPCFLILFSTVILFLFSYMILPSVMTMLDGYDLADSGLFVVLKWLNRGIIIFYLLLLLGLVVLLYCFQQNKTLDLWKFLHYFHFDRIIQKYTSYAFSQYLLVLLHHGISTRRSLLLLKEFREKPYVQFVAICLHEQFMKGESFQDAIRNPYLDTTFCFICNLGYQTNTVMDALREYKEIVEVWIQNKVKQVSIGIQCFAYGCIGIVVIVVYQIMFLPLSMFEQM